METLKNNLLIAEFMGYPFYYQDMYQHFGGPIEGDILEVGDIVSKTRAATYESHGLRFIASEDYRRVPMKWYDRSWDELMLVVQKINEVIPKCIPNNVILPDYMVKMKSLHFFGFNDREPFKLDISEIYGYCLEFITWHKENYNE